MRTVVFRTGSLGDTVCSVPAFRVLRRHFAGDELVLLHDAVGDGRVSALEVLEGAGIFDRIISYRGGGGWLSWVDLARAVRRLGPDRLVGLPQRMDRIGNLVWKRLFFRLLGVGEVMGFSGGRPSAGEGEVYRLLALLSGEGLDAGHPGYGFAVREPAAGRVRGWMRERRGGRPVMVVCGGGKTAAQRWGWARYGEVLAGLGEGLGVFIVGVGTPRERREAEREMSGRMQGMEWAPADWGIAELFELLRGAELYMGNDTGPMHVAAALGCPVFVVMSARNLPGAWDPDVEPRWVVRLRVECEGCFLSECPIPGQPCLGGIGVERVRAELLEFVRGHGLLAGARRGSVVWGGGDVKKSSAPCWGGPGEEPAGMGGSGSGVARDGDDLEGRLEAPF